MPPGSKAEHLGMQHESGWRRLPFVALACWSSPVPPPPYRIRPGASCRGVYGGYHFLYLTESNINDSKDGEWGPSPHKRS